MALQIGYHKIHESGIGFCTRDFEDNATRITLEITFALEKLEKNSRNLIFDGCTHMENVCLLPPAREYNLKTDPKSDTLQWLKI